MWPDGADQSTAGIVHHSDSSAPKRPRTAFLLFSLDRRGALDSADESDRAIALRLASLWESVSESEKDKYRTLAEEDKRRYEREMEQYRLTRAQSRQQQS